MYKKIILMIDDEVDFCTIVKLHLEAVTDYHVFFALDGKEGIALAKEIKPHLIILDIVMPGINGLDVLKKLKENETTMSIPVIMLTAMDDEQYKLKAAQLYDELYLVKPIGAAELKKKIEQVLNRTNVL